MGKWVNSQSFRAEVREYPGKCSVSFPCAQHPQVHTYYDISVVTSGPRVGYAQWDEEDTRGADLRAESGRVTRVGYMSMGTHMSATEKHECGTRPTIVQLD